MNRNPAGLQAVRVGASGIHFGSAGTPETLFSKVQAIRGADMVQAAAKILVWMEEPGRDAFDQAQRELVSGMFPDDVARDLHAALDAGGSSGGFDAIFYPGQLLTLQKLATRVGDPGRPTSFDDGALLAKFVLAAAEVADVRDSLAGDTLFDDDLGGAIYTFRAAEQNSIVDPTTVAGRAFRLWLDPRLAWPSSLEDPEAYCQRKFGVGLRQFVAVAAAPAIGRLRVDLADPSAVPFNPATYFAETRINPTAAVRIIDELTYRANRTGIEALRDPTNFWSFFDLADRPFVPCGSNIIVPCSLRRSLERATTGIFWMLHASNQGIVGTFTSHFGHLFEDYCLRVADGLQSESLIVGGEIEYGPSTYRKKTSDILISVLDDSAAPVRIFVECRAARPTAAVFASGSRDAFTRYVDDLASKLEQLSRVISDHQVGMFVVPGDMAAPDDGYIPLLVVDVPFNWSILLRNLLDRRIAEGGWFRDPRVAQPIVCGIDEFESLVQACEHGANLASLLRGYLGTDRRDPLEQHVFEQHGLLHPPSYTATGWEEWQELVRTELFG